jgi:WD40 repeat protein
VQLSGVPAEDIESPWYYENVGFYDRGRVAEFALSSCCWIDSSTIAVSDYNGGVRVLSSSCSSNSGGAGGGNAFEHIVAKWQHSSSARAVIKLSPSHLLSVGSDCNVRLFDLIDGRVATSAAMPQRLSSALYEQTLQHVAVGCSGGALLLLDPQTLQLVQTLPGHAAEITCVASQGATGSPLLLTSSLDATVRLWDVRTGKNSCHVLRMQRGSTAPLYSVLACGGSIVAGDEDGELAAWQGNDFVPVKSLYNNNGPPLPCYLAADSTGTLFSSASAVNNQQGMCGCVLVRQGLAQAPTYGVGDGQFEEISCLSLRDDGCACVYRTAMTISLYPVVAAVAFSVIVTSVFIYLANDLVVQARIAGRNP